MIRYPIKPKPGLPPFINCGNGGHCQPLFVVVADDHAVRRRAAGFLDPTLMAGGIALPSGAL
jgi:hypothetical protein